MVYYTVGEAGQTYRMRKRDGDIPDGVGQSQMKREEDRATVDGVKGEGREKLGKTKGEIDAKKWTKKEGQGYG